MERRNNPLDNSYLLARVLRFVDRPKTLVRAACVNSFWFSEAVKHLWAGSHAHGVWRTPDSQHLVRLQRSNRQRLQSYVLHIRHLILEPFQSPTGSLDLSLFGGCRALSVSLDLGTENMAEEQIMTVLQPNLRVLELYGGCYTNRFLHGLQTRSPRLAWLLLDNRTDEITPEAFTQYFEISRLKGIELVQGSESMLDETVKKKLLSAPQLQHLALGCTHSISEPLLRSSALCCSALRSLSISCVDGFAISKLLRSASGLQRLELDLLMNSFSVDVCREVLDPLAGCHALEELNFELDPEDVDGELIDAAFGSLMKGCPALQDLTLSCAGPLISAVTTANLFKELQRLRTVDLDFECEASPSALEAMSRNTSLRELHINADIDLLALSPPVQPFIHLTRLNARCLLPRGVTGPHRFWKVPLDEQQALVDDAARKWLPRLQSIGQSLNAENSHARKALAVLVKRLDGSRNEEPSIHDTVVRRLQEGVWRV